MRSGRAVLFTLAGCREPSGSVKVVFPLESLTPLTVGVTSNIRDEIQYVQSILSFKPIG